MLLVLIFGGLFFLNFASDKFARFSFSGVSISKLFWLATWPLDFDVRIRMKRNLISDLLLDMQLLSCILSSFLILW